MRSRPSSTALSGTMSCGWLSRISQLMSRSRSTSPGLSLLHQPFRSMGFVSVIIASVLFTLGLPLVLL